MNNKIADTETQDLSPRKGSNEVVVKNTTNEGEFSRSVIESLGTKVRCTDIDEDNNLELFCYVRCSSTDEDNLRKCRGVVLNGDNVVMKAFPFPLEFSNNDVDVINNTLGSIFSDCCVYDAHEGALIRMFNFNGRWFMTTHRKLNAFKSKWASKDSFGTSFKRALESEMSVNSGLRDRVGSVDSSNLLDKFQSTLDIDKQYMFLVCNTSENRIVCIPPERPTLYHVGTFVDGNLAMDIDCGIPYPRKHNFNSTDDMFTYINDLDCSKIQGVIVFAPDNTQYKIVHNEYQELFNVRGNEASIKYRYLQVRMNRKYSDILNWLYPEFVEIFAQYENFIYDISKSIYRSYVSRFIQKKHVTVPREEFSVMRECHDWHIMDRTNNLMTHEKVLNVVNNQSATNLNHMIRRFRTEQIRKNELQNAVEKRVRSNTLTSDGGVNNHRRILV